MKIKFEKNQGIPLDLSLLNELRVNTSAVERRCSELPGRRTVKKEWQIAWLLKAITLIDLTTLSGDDTTNRVKRLCHKALNPVSRQLLTKINFTEPIFTGAVCVYHEMVSTAVKMIQKKIPVAIVSAGFPAGLNSANLKQLEIIESLKEGADEVDAVISRRFVFEQNWSQLYKEIRVYRKLCKKSLLKVILATGDLRTLNNVHKAAWVTLMAGADFIKTSTGKEVVNATLPVSLVMMRAIREYYLLSGYTVGFKPAGGISNTNQALNMMYLIKEELGNEWLEPSLFRLGASSLLTDIERQLFHSINGFYSANCYHPIN